MISICFKWVNLCILAKNYSYLQGLITISRKATNLTLTIQEIPRPTYLTHCRTNTKKFSPFLQGHKLFNSLDNEVIKSQSLSSFKKKLRIKLLSKINMKTVHKSFLLRLFTIFSSTDVKQLQPVVRGGLTSHKLL